MRDAATVPRVGLGMQKNDGPRPRAVHAPLSVRPGQGRPAGVPFGFNQSQSLYWRNTSVA